MAATTDTWLADRNGDAVLVWSSVPGAALTGELAKAVTEVRSLPAETPVRPSALTGAGGARSSSASWSRPASISSPTARHHSSTSLPLRFAPTR